MNPVRALALRRVTVMAAGISSALVAHSVVLGGLHVTRVAPFTWGLLLVGAALCGGRRTFTPRSAPRTLLLLTGAQTALHVVLIAAPWSLGLAPHHHALPLVDARSVALHLVAALVLTALLRGGERALAAALAAALVVVRLLAPPVRRGAARLGTVLPLLDATPRGRTPRRPRTSRGPPAGHALPA